MEVDPHPDVKNSVAARGHSYSSRALPSCSAATSTSINMDRDDLLGGRTTEEVLPFASTPIHVPTENRSEGAVD